MTKRKGCPCWNNDQCEFNGFDCPAMDSCRHVEEKVKAARIHTTAPAPDTDRHDPRIELRRVCEQEEHDAQVAKMVRT